MTDNIDETDNRYKANLEKDFLKAFENTLGNITASCEKVGISRETFYQWYRENENFKNQIEAIRESRIDLTESKLFELVNGVNYKTPSGVVYTRPPDATAIIFFLKTQGKKRGYVERSEFVPLTHEEAKQIDAIPIEKILPIANAIDNASKLIEVKENKNGDDNTPVDKSGSGHN